MDIAKNSSNYDEDKTLLKWLLFREKFLEFNDLKTQKIFFKDIKKQKLLLFNLIKKLKSKGKKICGYGASTKGNVILQYCGLTEKHLDCIFEVNPFKFNRFTPGSKIRILSERYIKKVRPDYLLVLPWHFKEHIIKKEKNFLDKGGKLIFPLPEIEII